MQTLNNYQSIPSDVPLDQMVISTKMLDVDDIQDLAANDFTFTITAGRGRVNAPDYAWAYLVLQEVRNSPISERAYDYCEFHNITEKEAISWILPYIQPGKTLERIIDEVTGDWILTPKQYVNLNKRRLSDLSN